MRKPRPKAPEGDVQVRVRRIHRRDLNRTWEFLKLVFRDVNRETVEYQRPYSKRRFLEIYDQEGIEQLLFDTGSGDIVGYAECAFDTSGEDNWVNPRYFEKRGMRPLFVEELAVHPGYQGRGVGAFMLDQLQHLARVRGCTHLVLEVAENNTAALSWYRRRNFFKLDAAIFLAQKVTADPELLPPRKLPPPRPEDGGKRRHPATVAKAASKRAKEAAARARETKAAATGPKGAAQTLALPVEPAGAQTPPALSEKNASPKTGAQGKASTPAKPGAPAKAGAKTR